VQTVRSDDIIPDQAIVTHVWNEEGLEGHQSRIYAEGFHKDVLWDGRWPDSSWSRIGSPPRDHQCRTIPTSEKQWAYLSDFYSKIFVCNRSCPVRGCVRIRLGDYHIP
jgi:hypothetical protein